MEKIIQLFFIIIIIYIIYIFTKPPNVQKSKNEKSNQSQIQIKDQPKPVFKKKECEKIHQGLSADGHSLKKTINVVPTDLESYYKPALVNVPITQDIIPTQNIGDCPISKPLSTDLPIADVPLCYILNDKFSRKMSDTNIYKE